MMKSFSKLALTLALNILTAVGCGPSMSEIQARYDVRIQALEGLVETLDNDIGVERRARLEETQRTRNQIDEAVEAAEGRLTGCAERLRELEVYRQRISDWSVASDFGEEQNEEHLIVFALYALRAGRPRDAAAAFRAGARHYNRRDTNRASAYRMLAAAAFSFAGVPRLADQYSDRALGTQREPSTRLQRIQAIAFSLADILGERRLEGVPSILEGELAPLREFFTPHEQISPCESVAMW